MFARVTTTQFSPYRMDEAIHIVRERVLPAVQQETGFKGYLMLVDRSTGKGITITLWEEETMARQFSHLTARDAAALAVRAGVKQLILTHISRRYRAKDVLAQARAVFPNTVVACDFDNFRIGGDGL